MSVNKYLVPLLALILFFSVVGVAMANGNWIVSGKQMVDVENLTSSADIKGWMTLQQVADGFGLSTAELYALASLPADLPAGTALKDLEGVLPDFEVTSVREIVAARIGESVAANSEPAREEPRATAPSASVEPSPVPSPAPAATSTPRTEPTPAVAATTEHVPQGDGIGEGDGSGPTPVPAGTILAAAEIKGKHTLQEISVQAQVPLADLFAALELPADQDPAVTVKDLVGAGKVSEVDAVRSAVAALQAK